MLTCRTLRGAVLTSASLLFGAWLLSLLLGWPRLSPVLLGYLDLLLLFAAAGVLVLTLAFSLLPSNRARLSRCGH